MQLIPEMPYSNNESSAFKHLLLWYILSYEKASR